MLLLLLGPLLLPLGALLIFVVVANTTVAGVGQVSTFLQNIAISKTIKEQLATVATTATAL